MGAGLGASPRRSSNTSRRSFSSVIRLALTLALLAGPALAQRPAAPSQPPGGAPAAPASSAAQRRAIPPESVTHHAIDLPGRTLHITASVGAIRLTDERGEPEADIVVTAYTLDGADPATRPLTLAVNGGPGAGTAWLQLGGLGPWRVAMDGAGLSPSAAPTLQPNAETWLDFTDLAFFDPPGTGFSRIVATGEAAAAASKRLYSVQGDIAALAEVQRQWLQQARRMASPKFVVGESYGGFRGPRLVRALLEQQGVGISGLILVSPKLDYGGGSSSFDPLSYAERLPSLVAATREAAGPVDRSAMADVEAYAAGPYLTDLVRGAADPEAVARVSAKVADLTGLDPTLVRQHHGEIDTNTWLRERLRANGEVASPYDTTVTDPDPFPYSSFSNHPDPITDALRGPVTSAMVDLYQQRLNWLPEGRETYELLNGAVAGAWDYGRFGSPESVSMLRAALALDPRLRVLIGHGLTDIVTPYFATQLELNTFPPALGARVKLVVLPGGHMFYARDASRQAFRAAAAELYPRP